MLYGPSSSRIVTFLAFGRQTSSLTRLAILGRWPSSTNTFAHAFLRNPGKKLPVDVRDERQTGLGDDLDAGCRVCIRKAC